jgi:hypothetical protein
VHRRTNYQSSIRAFFVARRELVPTVSSSLVLRWLALALALFRR